MRFFVPLFNFYLTFVVQLFCNAAELARIAVVSIMVYEEHTSTLYFSNIEVNDVLVNLVSCGIAMPPNITHRENVPGRC